MKRLHLVIIFSLFILFLKAENDNFKSAFIITMQNDTIFGFVNFDTDLNNAKICRFKETETSVEKKYSPGSIQSFFFIEPGKFYVSKKVTIKNQQVELFLEYLIKGIINVYYQYDGEQENYFFEQEDGRITMVTKESTELKDGVYSKDLKYDGQLRYLFKDYVPEYYKTKPIRFDQSTIIGMAKSYHEAVCTTGEQCIVYENKNPDAEVLKMKFTAYLGFTTFDYFVNSINYQTGSGVMSDNFCPVLGLQMNVFYPRLSNSISLHLDLSYTQFSTNKTFIYQSYEAESKGNLMISKFGLKYKYPKYKLRPFFELGAGYMFSLNSESTIYKYIHNYFVESQDYTIRKSYTIIYGGVGVEYKLKTENALFLRFTYDSSLMNNLKTHGADLVKLKQINLGYIF